MTGEAPLAYRFLGMLVCPDCAQGVDMLKRQPVLADQVPENLIAHCTVCEVPILFQPCPFCEIAAGRAEAEWILQPDFWPETLAFVPLDPIAEGHCLIVPKRHVRDFAQDPEVFAQTARRAAELMRWSDRPMNLISTRGREAGQRVMHLHLHLIPREEGDDIRLIQKKGAKR